MLCGPPTGTLYAVYEREYYYWEVVELFRKLLLTAGLVVVENGSPVQLLLGLFIAAVYIVAFTQYQPFEEDLDDMLQIICSFQIIVTMGMGLAIGWSDLRGEHATEVGQAKEATNTAVLGVLLIIMNGFIFIIGLWSAAMCSEKFSKYALMAQRKLPCLFKGGGMGAKIVAGLGALDEDDGGEEDADDKDALIAAIKEMCEKFEADREKIEAKKKKLEALKLEDKEKIIEVPPGSDSDGISSSFQRAPDQVQVKTGPTKEETQVEVKTDGAEQVAET